MLFAVLFEDNDDCADDVRSRYMPAHLEFLTRHVSMIRSAGPLRNQEGLAAGGLWLVEADAPDAVDRLVRDDPFWPTGLRRSVRVLTWKQVFADGARVGA
ncbi:hypothetical protein BJG93_29840 (plasmid) [Paraburkholderia sprentiae WSM5005]|uniref:YCII-related domain-containing protein n=1 Tax=Paraburkholderia sprentiae WSM5005 TaxID=754502 RepID=A0A1I9YU02_9BURK|nr:YciI family protein [Paraburkholderia sprentiae]APA89682.1 hypothetical protein BJG93_29840 [Paraburkholderia sprentiae WSM5005]